MKYTGSWSVNNGSTYGYGYESNNKKELAKLMREIAQGNVFSGNIGSWSVKDVAGDPIDQPVLSGLVRN